MHDENERAKERGTFCGVLVVADGVAQIESISLGSCTSSKDELHICSNGVQSVGRSGRGVISSALRGEGGRQVTPSSPECARKAQRVLFKGGFEFGDGGRHKGGLVRRELESLNGGLSESQMS